ncbi:MAG: YjjG family noncanonical pyrimidine nucleotidase [Candidatus Sumerlaeia bacterium]|nr:YjjG family noncanonical pyrimidine nucleotidase [Candidatus Sumerlaeia bacterium]
MNLIKVVFFDLDNTVWDHQHAQETAINKLAQKYALPAVEFNNIYNYFNERAWRMFSKNQLSLSEMRLYRFVLTLEALGNIAAGLDAQVIAREYLDLYELETAHLRPYADMVIKVLSQRYKIGILTNGFREIQLKKINALGLIQYINYFITADDAGCLKPSPEFFHYALRKCDASAEEIMFVGDSYDEDVIGGKKAGFKMVWYNPELREVKNLNCEITPDYIITDLRELLSILQIHQVC